MSCLVKLTTDRNHQAVLEHYQWNALHAHSIGVYSCPVSNILPYQEETLTSDNFRVRFTIHSHSSEIIVYAPKSEIAQTVFTYTIVKQRPHLPLKVNYEIKINSKKNHHEVVWDYQSRATHTPTLEETQFPVIKPYQEETLASDNFRVRFTILSDSKQIAVYSPESKKAHLIFTYTLGKPPTVSCEIVDFLVDDPEPRALWWRAIAGFILSLGLGVGVAALMGHVGNRFIMEKSLWAVGGAGSAIVAGVATGFWLQNTHKHNQVLSRQLIWVTRNLPDD